MLAVRRAGDHVGLPRERAFVVVEARVLLRQIDVDVALAPIASVQPVVGARLLFARDGHVAGLRGTHAVRHRLLQLALVDDPAVYAA